MRFSSSPFKYEVFNDYFKELYNAKENNQDNLVEAVEAFSRVIYENLDNINHEEVASALKELFDTIKASKSQKSQLMNSLILILNDIFDAFYPPQMNESLRV